MCAVALTLTLIASSCPPATVQRSDVQAPISARIAQARRLGDPELGRIRGGHGYIAKTGKNGVVRLVQDSNTRDMALPALSAVQSMDAWWTEIGSAYIAQSLSRP